MKRSFARFVGVCNLSDREPKRYSNAPHSNKFIKAYASIYNTWGYSSAGSPRGAVTPHSDNFIEAYTRFASSGGIAQLGA